MRQIAVKIKMDGVCLSDPKKPVGCFLLIGPSCSSKTEIVLALTQAVFGFEYTNEFALLRSSFGATCRGVTWKLCQQSRGIRWSEVWSRLLAVIVSLKRN